MPAPRLTDQPDQQLDNTWIPDNYMDWVHHGVLPETIDPTDWDPKTYSYWSEPQLKHPTRHTTITTVTANNRVHTRLRMRPVLWPPGDRYVQELTIISECPDEQQWDDFIAAGPPLCVPILPSSLDVEEEYSVYKMLSYVQLFNSYIQRQQMFAVAMRNAYTAMTYMETELDIYCWDEAHPQQQERLRRFKQLRHAVMG